jgi:hypothetical protein
MRDKPMCLLDVLAWGIELRLGLRDQIDSCREGLLCCQGSDLDLFLLHH